MRAGRRHKKSVAQNAVEAMHSIKSLQLNSCSKRKAPITLAEVT